MQKTSKKALAEEKVRRRKLIFAVFVKILCKNHKIWSILTTFAQNP